MICAMLYKSNKGKGVNMFVSELKIGLLRLVGGLAVLDYLNTCNGRRPGSSLGKTVDKLSTLEDVVRWFYRVRLIDDEELEYCLELAEQPLAAFSFKRLVAFREELYQLMLPIAEGGPVGIVALESLNQILLSTASQRKLGVQGRHVTWQWRFPKSLDEMTDAFISRLAIQAADLLTGPDHLRLKVCGTPDCDWLFIDSSKNGGRRWCQMNICGSREKARKRGGAHSNR
jgi:predicted RNA-binding Zn ribbon-like protein